MTARAPGPSTLRLVAWNIRAGGGKRVEAIAASLARWRADVVALGEFRATPPSRALAARLAARGLRYQRTTAEPEAAARNALLVASRWPLRRIALRAPPAEPARWLAVRVRAPVPFALGLLHAPNYVTGRKYPFLDAVVAAAGALGRGPAIIAGDSNSTQRHLDEQVPFLAIPEEHFIDEMLALGWCDAWRHLHGERRTYSWYSPNGRNGYRLDQAFVSGPLTPRVAAASYRWGRTRPPSARRDAVSDHAAIVVDLRLDGTR